MKWTVNKMTNEEIIKKIDMMIAQEGTLGEFSKMGKDFYIKNIEALKIAKQAVEKQIPISPSNKAYCRSCGSKLLGSENFCSNCGQKLNWKGKEFDLLFDDLTDELNLIEIETSVPKVLIYPNLIYFKQ